eukprot:m.464804 g.464804  ORF g.464804 m.464804 type:complete len:358 (-) comp21624_c0_seq8:700-1773(-)
MSTADDSESSELRMYNFFEDGTSAPIDSIRWESASAVRHIEGGLGSSGILLVKLSGNSVVVLKPGHPTNLTAELFATKLAKSAGVTCPDARMLSESECRRVNSAVQKAPFADESHRAGMRRRHQKGNHEWLVETFMSGVPMYASVKCSELLGLSDDDTDEGEIARAQRLFRDIGRVCVVDAILNNMDRLPFFHHNAGNICNWIVSVKTDDEECVVPQAIDLQANAIMNEDGKTTYIERVQSIVTSTRTVLEQIKEASSPQDVGTIWRGCPVVKPCVARVQQHFADNLGVTVSDRSVTWLLEGIVDQCNKSRNLAATIEDLFTATKTEVLEARGNDGRYQEQLAAIDVPFIQQLCSSL